MEINTNLHQHHSCNPGIDLPPNRGSICPVFINNAPLAIPHTHSTTKATDDYSQGPSPHMFQQTHPQTSPLQENKPEELLKVSSCPEESSPKHRLLLSRHQTSALSVPSFPNTPGPSLAAEKLILKLHLPHHPEACSPQSCCQE